MDMILDAAPLREDELLGLLSQQRKAFLADPYPSSAIRQDRIARARAALVTNKARIIAAVDADFQGRPKPLTMIADLLHPLTALKDARQKVTRWMRPEARRPEFPMGLLGVKTWVEFQPLGVVGVMSPWNAPIALTFTPLAGILAAGNRAMIKPSEFSPHVSALIAEMIASAFAPEEVAVVQGGVETAKAFAALPFDHLLYTGGALTARHVMRAAAANLTPVTLELGGKSPAIIGAGADISLAASKIMGGKLSNAGQICMCPDHAWVPEGQIDAFVDAARAAGQRMWPSIIGNPDVTAVVGEKSRARLHAAIAEARDAGVTVIELTPADPARPQMLAPVLVVDPPAHCALNRQEIFGPVLVIRSYQTLSPLIDALNNEETPLAVYFFGDHEDEIDIVRKRMRAGGMTLNDVMLHPFMQDLPFGGLGQSGMGRYIGHDGFKTFSHHKSTARRGWVDITKYIQPPFSERFVKILDMATK
jgi:coniferyl-aldehyde dehydrogenase